MTADTIAPRRHGRAAHLQALEGQLLPCVSGAMVHRREIAGGSEPGAMRAAAPYWVFAGLLGLTALSSASAAEGTPNAPPHCPPASQEQRGAAHFVRPLQAELPWLATGMRPEEVARFLRPCVVIEGAEQPTPAARQPAEGPAAAPNAGRTQLR